MLLFRYFQPTQPTARETDLGEAVVQATNAAVFQEIQNTTNKTGAGKCKAHIAFSDEQTAAIGKYASENGNAAKRINKLRIHLYRD